MPHAGASPAAVFAYSPTGAVGPCIRLYAARPLFSGDEVTITYGEHSSGHFAQYYGFVPVNNPHDSVDVSLLQILHASGLSPEDGKWGDRWDKVCVLLQQKFGLQTERLQLKARAPDEATVLALRAILLGQDGAATLLTRTEQSTAMDLNEHDEALDADCDGLVESGCAADAYMIARIAQIVASACTGICAGWPSTLEDDRSELSKRQASMQWAPQLLLQMRIARKQLVHELRESMLHLASRIEKDPSISWTTLRQQQLPASTYPYLDDLPISELEGWAARRWNWKSSSYEP
eukprot:scaffold32247_cov35-Tisochrysis_lutea.AAC.2